MFTFTEDDRASLGWMRGIAQDPQGRAVLVGLTFEETDFYTPTEESSSLPSVIVIASIKSAI
jgi:hypothetical protein